MEEMQFAVSDDTQLSCREFVGVLASSKPVPGGGGAAALAGAVGTALGNMVGSLTVGKKKYAAVEEEILALMERCKDLQEELLNQVQEDALGFAPLAKAYGIPKEDPERDVILEAAGKAACAVPFKIMELCCEAIEAAKSFSEKGSRLAISDAGCAAVLLKAALQAASLNVYINTKSLRDRAYAKKMNSETEEMLNRYSSMAEEIYQSVREALLV